MEQNLCRICRKHPIEVRDYRFIDSVGLQGKVLVCKLCYGLNDATIVDVMRDELDPETFYEPLIKETGGEYDETV